MHNKGSYCSLEFKKSLKETLLVLTFVAGYGFTSALYILSLYGFVIFFTT